MQNSTNRTKTGTAAKPFFTRGALAFLRGLERNNRRDWFEPRKQEFERELKQPMLAVVGAITEAMDFAPEYLRPPQKIMMRIYRDTRFSQDKRPYKTQVAGWWACAGMEKTSGAGYYMHLSAKEVVIAAGVYMPAREQLLAIRTYLLEHHVQMRRLLEDRKLRSLMDSFSGEPLTRAPKGFPKDHPAIDLILCRQWGVSCTLAAEAALSPAFTAQVIRRFRLAAKLVDTLNAPLIPERKQKRKLPFGLY